MSSKDKLMAMMIGGILIMLLLLIIGDFIIIFTSKESARAVSTEILTIIKMGITGILGLIAGHMSKEKKED